LRSGHGGKKNESCCEKQGRGELGSFHGTLRAAIRFCTWDAALTGYVTAELTR
jgi:hypothetical protein